MDNTRRDFVRGAAALTAAAVPRSVLGANERVLVGLIGAGGRGGAMGQAARKHEYTTVVASCDVDRGRREAFAKGGGPECEVYDDYRRVLDRKDIDGVIIATPDHWHSPITVQALEAGKHVYVEKPLSNTVDGAAKMLTAYEKHNKVVQVGTMQRSGVHFQEAVRLLQTGGIGPITQVVVTHPAGGSADRRLDTTPQPVPEGFDWEKWQGSAPKHPYTPSRARNWRAWYDYGGGTLTDWGIHHVDIVHMAMDPDGSKPPLFVAAASNYEFIDNPDRDAVPGTWAVTVQYEHFIMAVLSCTPAPSGHLIQGPTFWGSRGQLLVNRAGYSVVPVSAYSPYMTDLGMANRVGAPAQPPPAPPAARAGGAAPGRGPAGMPGRAPQLPPIEAREVLIENFGRLEGAYTTNHMWNWLDCIKSGEKPIGDLARCFNGHLSCLMARESMLTGRALRWDPKTRTARPA